MSPRSANSSTAAMRSRQSPARRSSARSSMEREQPEKTRAAETAAIRLQRLSLLIGSGAARPEVVDDGQRRELHQGPQAPEGGHPDAVGQGEPGRRDAGDQGPQEQPQDGRPDGPPP